MHRAGIVAPLLILFAAGPAWADETAEPAAAEPFAAGSISGVTLGVAGGVSIFGANAEGQLRSGPAPSIHAYGGYCFSNGLSPELALFHTGSVSALSPGLRFWLPEGGRLRPWVGLHGGVAHVTLTSGDTTTGSSYWSVDGGGGLDVMITPALSFGLGGDWTYANALNPPRAQPVPAGSVAAPAPSNAIDWLTLRAGFGVIL